MSQQTEILNNQNQLTVNNDTTKIFVGGNKDATASYTNSTYDDVTLTEGTLLGKVSATGKVKPLASAAVDGSQYPIGILRQTTTIGAGETVTLTFVTAGDVVKTKVILSGSDTMSTVISGRSIQDRIGGDTVGVNLVGSTQNTAYDNQ